MGPDPLVIGHKEPAAGLPEDAFSGILDEVFLYDRALNALEVRRPFPASSRFELK